MDERIERQELFCHSCENYVQFNMDVSLNGNHVLNCPECNHEHCRVVKDGVITGERWAQRNGPTIHVNIRTITTAVTAIGVGADDFAKNAWAVSVAVSSMSSSVSALNTAITNSTTSTSTGG